MAEPQQRVVETKLGGKLYPQQAGVPNLNRKGVPNKTTRLLKEALLIAAEVHGNNGKGKDGLVGFLLFLIEKDLGAFASLLGRVLPLQINVRESDHAAKMQSRRELLFELKRRGVTINGGVFIGDDDRVLDAEIIEKPKTMRDDGTPVPGA